MDENKKKAIEELGISEELFDEIFKDFLDQCDEYIRTIEDSINSNNLEDLAKAAHKLKGSSGNLGLENIQQLARAIEIAAKEKKDIEIAKQEFIKLKEAVLAIRAGY